MVLCFCVALIEHLNEIEETQFSILVALFSEIPQNGGINNDISVHSWILRYVSFIGALF